jgi:SAM-dependent methyltransferase
MEQILENCQCLRCGAVNSLSTNDGKDLSCYKCGYKYPIVNGIPIVIDEEKSVFTFDDFINKKNLFFDISQQKSIKETIVKLIPKLSINWVAQKNYAAIAQLLKTNNLNKPKILILGGSIEGEGSQDFLNSPHLQIIESDVSFGPRTQIVLDAHTIPYQAETFDCVVAQAVLEHVLDPFKCVEEIYRVLKPNGIIYVEIPFMQQVHGGAYDFTRFTRSGQRRLLRQFEEIDSGIVAGPGTVLAWSYEYLLLSIFGYSEPIKLLLKALARLTGFWLKYLDFFARWNSHAVDAASGLYFIGKKSKNFCLTDKEILEYYNKT